LQDKQWSLIVANAWADEQFKGRLKADPKTVLREFGIEMPAGIEVCVSEEGQGDATFSDADNLFHFTIPANPGDDLWEEELTPGPVAYCYCGGCFRCYRCGCGCGACGFCSI
jgi:hypothetical protein